MGVETRVSDQGIEGASGNTYERVFSIGNQYGIHARPAAMIVETASRFDADVTIEKDGNRVSAKSMLGLMTLEASHGTKLRVICEGPDAEQVLDELERLIKANFNED